MAAKRAAQATLPFRAWGGRRPGAGRKPTTKSRRNQRHQKRPTHCAREPLHITLRVVRGLPNLRSQSIARVLRGAFVDSRRAWFRVVQYSIQGDHLHVLAEAEDAPSLSRGVAGLAIRIARRLNALLRRRGPVFSERYHARPLRSPLEARRAIVYVLLNVYKHGATGHGIDPMSTGRAFDGWAEPAVETRPTHDEARVWGVQPPQTWLLRHGWRRHGLIALCERPMQKN